MPYFKEFKAFREKIAEKIYQIRLQRNLTQIDMKKFGLSRRTYIRVEKEGPHSLAQLFQIAKALKVKPQELLDV